MKHFCLRLLVNLNYLSSFYVGESWTPWDSVTIVAKWGTIREKRGGGVELYFSNRSIEHPKHILTALKKNSHREEDSQPVAPSLLAVLDGVHPRNPLTIKKL